MKTHTYYAPGTGNALVAVRCRDGEAGALLSGAGIDVSGLDYRPEGIATPYDAPRGDLAWYWEGLFLDQDFAVADLPIGESAERHRRLQAVAWNYHARVLQNRGNIAKEPRWLWQIGERTRLIDYVAVPWPDVIQILKENV